MSWLFAVLLVGLVGAVAVVLAGGGGGAAAAYDDRADAGLPDHRPLTGRDVREVRLNTAVRGYRADEVDDLLARLARELDARDEAEERGRPVPTDGPPDGSPDEDPGEVTDR